MAYAVIATYTAEDGLDDLEQEVFESLDNARECFEAYKVWHGFRDVQLWDTSTNTRLG